MPGAHQQFAYPCMDPKNDAVNMSLWMVVGVFILENPPLSFLSFFTLFQIHP